MNQQCKVCGEPAAGFHFGAFTCEGCKSFFGRTYNNLSSISECKNNGECIINKKNRTACKACRLRKCLLVGMSKSGSRYGRRSNWFKIHCLLQEQQQKNTNTNSQTPSPGLLSNSFMPSHFLTNLCGSKHQDTRRTSSPSDSGASSADLEDNSMKDGSIESSLESKTEKSSISSYKTDLFRPGLDQLSSYIPATQFNHHNHYLNLSNINNNNNNNINNNNNNINHYNNHHNNNHNHHNHNNNNNYVQQMTPIIIPSVVRLPTIKIEEQDEPIDLSIKSRQIQITRIPSPVIIVADNITVKPVPLDLTLVRPKSLSG